MFIRAYCRSKRKLTKEAGLKEKGPLKLTKEAGLKEKGPLRNPSATSAPRTASWIYQYISQKDSLEKHIATQRGVPVDQGYVALKNSKMWCHVGPETDQSRFSFLFFSFPLFFQQAGSAMDEVLIFITATQGTGQTRSTIRETGREG